MNDEAATQYQTLIDAFNATAACQRAWRVLAQGDVRTTYQRKVHAGATQLENRVPLRRSLTGPPALATNIAIPTFEAGRQAVYLLPDRLLVRDGRRYADISYATVSSDSKTIVFIEDGKAPIDSDVVGTTWRFVNKSGGPDRRFKDNRQLPKLAYGEFSLGSSSASAGLAIFPTGSRGHHGRGAWFGSGTSSASARSFAIEGRFI